MKSIDKLGISATPWTCEEDAIHGIESNEITICNAWETQHVCKEIAIANARLIAAAPDCYEALEAVISWYERNKPLPYEENGIQMIMDYAKKAIAKASGEDQNEVNNNEL